MQNADSTQADHKIKILVGYHKPSLLFKNNILTPIHVGRDVANEASKDGKNDEKSQQWLADHLIGDNTGDNISFKNRSYNEMTAIYWAWKNLDQLGNPEYIGFMHYRRQFIFDDNAVPFFNGIPFEAPDSQFRIDTLSEENIATLFNETVIEKALQDTDIILPRAVHWDFSVYDQYLAASGQAHQIRDLNVTLQVLKEEFPDYYPTAVDYMNGTKHYWWNMFVMRTDIFKQYCEFMFSVLFRTETFIDILEPSMTERTIVQKRLYGFLSERLSGIYFTYLRNQANLRIKEKYTILEMFLQK